MDLARKGGNDGGADNMGYDGFSEELVLMLLLSSRSRPGLRVAKRRRCQSRIGAPHRIHQADTMKWFKAKYDATVR